MHPHPKKNGSTNNHTKNDDHNDTINNNINDDNINDSDHRFYDNLTEGPSALLQTFSFICHHFGNLFMLTACDGQKEHTYTKLPLCLNFQNYSILQMHLYILQY